MIENDGKLCEFTVVPYDSDCTESALSSCSGAVGVVNLARMSKAVDCLSGSHALLALRREESMSLDGLRMYILDEQCKRMDR